MVWDVLIPCVQPEITLVSLLVDLLTAVLGANIVCVVVMTLPIPHPALWLVRWRLEELAAIMAKFVEDAVASFCLEDDSGAWRCLCWRPTLPIGPPTHTQPTPINHQCTAPTQINPIQSNPTNSPHPTKITELYDLEGVLDEAAALLQQARALLPDVRFELSLLLGGRRGGDRAVAYDRLARYLTVLESQVRLLTFAFPLLFSCACAFRIGPIRSFHSIPPGGELPGHGRGPRRHLPQRHTRRVRPRHAARAAGPRPRVPRRARRGT